MQPIVYMLLRLRQIFAREGPRLRRVAIESPLLEALESIARQRDQTLQTAAVELVEEGLTYRELLCDANQRWSSLTQREKQVAKLVSEGCTNREVALELGISEDTIKTHMHSVLGKFQVRNREELKMRMRE
jgi:DNA-binding CsgD family transcriptional regulator